MTSDSQITSLEKSSKKVVRIPNKISRDKQVMPVKTNKSPLLLVFCLDFCPLSMDEYLI
jgi:hypothetical protein